MDESGMGIGNDDTYTSRRDIAKTALESIVPIAALSGAWLAHEPMTKAFDGKPAETIEVPILNGVSMNKDCIYGAEGAGLLIGSVLLGAYISKIASNALNSFHASYF